MAKAIPLILIFIVLFLVARCDQQQAIQRSRSGTTHANPPVENPS